jgi:hypothetical protein
MGCSLRIPMRHGTLKIKSKNKLRYREIYWEVPTFRLFSTYFFWEQKAPSRANQALKERRPGRGEQLG